MVRQLIADVCPVFLLYYDTRLSGYVRMYVGTHVCMYVIIYYEASVIPVIPMYLGGGEEPRIGTNKHLHIPTSR